jgi:hypothetical protein
LRKLAATGRLAIIFKIKCNLVFRHHGHRNRRYHRAAKNPGHNGNTRETAQNVHDVAPFSLFFGNISALNNPEIIAENGAKGKCQKYRQSVKRMTALANFWTSEDLFKIPGILLISRQVARIALLRLRGARIGRYFESDIEKAHLLDAK